MKPLLTVALFLWLHTATVAQNNLGWFKTFVGSIDKYPITMHLHKTGDKVSGHYYYHSRFESISLSGAINKNEINLKADENEAFTLTLVVDDLTGKWTGKAKTMNVNLKKLSNTALEFDYIFTEGTQVMHPKMESSPKAEFSQNSVWPKGNTPQDKMLKKWIRESFGDGKSEEDIGKIFLKNKAKLFKAFGASKIPEKELKDYLNLNREEQGSISLLFQTPKLLTLTYFGYSYEGGAHGNWGISYQSFDLVNNKSLEVNDVLAVSGQKLLPQLLEKYCRKAYNIAPTEKLSSLLFQDTIKPNHNFYVTPKGICFGYPPYEIAAYAAGQIEIYIPFTELSAHLTPQFKALI